MYVRTCIISDSYLAQILIVKECEMLVLTKLNWNLPSVVAVDFIHHILQVVDYSPSVVAVDYK